jgi:catechol 2,3-dioxygenase-like lactoylglutathione lyase family enzyme
MALTDAGECSCCGEARGVVALQSRDDVRLCRDCVEWLAGRLGVSSTPTLPVTSLPAAVEFYERAGFGVRVWVDPDTGPGGFAFVDYDGQSVFDLGVADIDPARNGAGCYLITPDADAWHARMVDAGLPVTALEDQPWGMREFTLTDPSGNHVRIGRSSAGPEA